MAYFSESRPAFADLPAPDGLRGTLPERLGASLQRSGLRALKECPNIQELEYAGLHPGVAGEEPGLTSQKADFAFLWPTLAGRALYSPVRGHRHVGDPDRQRCVALSCEGMKVRDLIRLLESAGWRLKTTKGSRRQFRHPDKGLVVTVPGQLGKDIPVGTLKAILRSAGLGRKVED